MTDRTVRRRAKERVDETKAVTSTPSTSPKKILFSTPHSGHGPHATIGSYDVSIVR
jgi:hypothetical protein